MIDLCRMLKAELIIVARAGLGTLNHTFLTIEYAKSHNLTCSVIISGCSENPDIIEQDNIVQIREMAGGRLIGCIPVLEGVDTERPEAVEIELDLRIQL